METEIPAMLRAREAFEAERFTFHSSRMRMKKVTREELAAMDADAGRCALELSDARVDIIGYACLIAIMSQGNGYHRQSEARLRAAVAGNGPDIPMVTSAGALVEGVKRLGAKSVAMITPCHRSLTQLVVEYLEAEGIDVVDCVSLEITDNVEVGRRDPMAHVDTAKKLQLGGADLIVASACVQMPSLAAIPEIEAKFGRPTVSAATCTVFSMLQCRGLRPIVPQGGALLARNLAELH